MGCKWPNKIAWCLVLMLSGCVAQKQVIDPYAAKQQRDDISARQEGEGIKVESSSQDMQEPAVLPVKDLLMPTLTLINDRIYAYEQKLEALRELQEQTMSRPPSQETLNAMSDCRAQLQRVLVEYNALNQRLLQKTDLQAAQLLAADSLLQLSEKDINYLESSCQNLMVAPLVSPQQLPVQTKSLHAEEQLLKAAAAVDDYATVISHYEQLPLEAGQVPSFDTTFLYGQALLKTSREPEARKVFTDLLSIIRKQDQAQWEFRLMQLIGDLEFGLEIFDGAKDKYKELAAIYEGLSSKNEWALQQVSALDRNVYQTDEVRSYAQLLKAYLGYNPDRDGYGVVEQAEKYIAKYPYSPVASNADLVLERAKTEADAWLKSVLARIDSLVEEKKFQEALLLIERVPRDILPVEKQEMLRRKNDQLLTAESISIETSRLVQEQELQEEWNQGMLLLEAREYDQAIEVFTSLMASSYAGKARERIDEAAKLAAKEDRQRAAEIFMRANRTGDLESKIKLLFASRKLLQDILIKYPQSGLSDKVNRNLVRIEEEINRIDPTLLTTPITVGEGTTL